MIKSSFPMPPMIERNRDERMPFAGPGMAVKGLGQPLDQPPLLVIFVPVLEADDGLAHLPFRAIPGPRPLEMPLLIYTMVTKKSRALAFERGIRIPALSADRALNSHRFRLGALRPGKGQVQGALGPVPGAGVGAVSGTTEG